MERKQFTFYRSYYEAVKTLPKKEQVSVILAICDYALNNEEPRLNGTAKAIFGLIRPTLDSSRRKAESGKQGGSKPQASGKQTESKSEANCKQTASEKENKNKNENEIEKERENECSLPLPPLTEGEAGKPPVPSEEEPKPVRHKFGVYGWVKLTDEEYTRLVNDLGQAEADRCIRYVDESAQGNSNKNKWTDWNLVVRKCHRENWGVKPTGYGKKQAAPQSREEMEQNAAGWMKQYIRR